MWSGCSPTTGYTRSAWASRPPPSMRSPRALGRPILRRRRRNWRGAMVRLDETRPFLPVNIAILTVSDTRGPADDKSGQTLVDLATKDGHRIAARAIVRDET